MNIKFLIFAVLVIGSVVGMVGDKAICMEPSFRSLPDVTIFAVDATSLEEPLARYVVLPKSEPLKANDNLGVTEVFAWRLRRHLKPELTPGTDFIATHIVLHHAADLGADGNKVDVAFLPMLLTTPKVKTPTLVAQTSTKTVFIISNTINPEQFSEEAARSSLSKAMKELFQWSPGKEDLDTVKKEKNFSFTIKKDKRPQNIFATIRAVVTANHIALSFGVYAPNEIEPMHVPERDGWFQLEKEVNESRKKIALQNISPLPDAAVFAVDATSLEEPLARYVVLPKSEPLKVNDNLGVTEVFAWRLRRHLKPELTPGTDFIATHIVLHHAADLGTDGNKVDVAFLPVIFTTPNIKAPVLVAQTADKTVFTVLHVSTPEQFSEEAARNALSKAMKELFQWSPKKEDLEVVKKEKSFSFAIKKDKQPKNIFSTLRAVVTANHISLSFGVYTPEEIEPMRAPEPDGWFALEK